MTKNAQVLAVTGDARSSDATQANVGDSSIPATRFDGMQHHSAHNLSAKGDGDASCDSVGPQLQKRQQPLAKESAKRHQVLPGDLWDDTGTSKSKAIMNMQREHLREVDDPPALLAMSQDSDSDEESDDDDEHDDGGAPRTRRPLTIPKELAPQLITLKDLAREQYQWEHTRELRHKVEQVAQGQREECHLTRDYEVHEGVLCRRIRAEEESRDSLRPFVPPNLRKTILGNYHRSIWGAHRGEKTTFKEVASRYFWNGMYEDVREYVSTCDVCQLAKGGQPSRQGLLNGRHYSHVFTQLCMDLVGPIHQAGNTSEKYILTIVEPFCHFVWLELVDTKHAETISAAFIRRILLEEGAPRCILTDNGSEFKNEHLKGLMEALEVSHQFSPKYHPQSNQAERSNRYIGETLRALVRSPGAAAKDWAKYLPYVEFAMRRTPIPGTNITPYLAMRGREPILPIDLPLAERAPTYDPDLAKHVQELQRVKHTAEKLIRSARERTMAKNKDLHDLGRSHITFAVGDMVRLWGVQRSTGGDAGKLKLRNGVYEVTARRGDMYDLRHTTYPELAKTNFHVSQIARWRGSAPAQAQATPPSAAPTPVRNDDDDDEVPTAAVQKTQGEMWDGLREHELCCFVMRDENPAYLRTAEVVKLADDKRSGEFWFWIDSKPGAYKPAQRIADRKLVPEWADERGNTQIRPTAEQQAIWAPRQHTLSMEEIEIILPVMKVRTGGQVIPTHVDKVKSWLRERAKTDRRAERALRYLGVAGAHRHQEEEAHDGAHLRSQLLQVLRLDSITDDRERRQKTKDMLSHGSDIGRSAESQKQHATICELIEQWSPSTLVCSISSKT